MNKHLLALSGLSVMILSGCGSSGSDATNDEYPSSYIQFYNASDNSYTTSLELNESSIGSASLSDVTSMVTVTPDNYDLSLTYIDENGDEVTPVEQSVDLVASTKHLFVLAGDLNEANLLHFNWNRESLVEDEEIIFYGSNLSSNTANLDIYIGEAGEDLSEAEFITSTSHQAMSDAFTFTEGEYRFFVTAAGSDEVAFKSDLIDFSYNTEYLLAIRDSYGPSESDYSLDIIANSTAVTHMSDEQAVGQFRIYNSIEGENELKVNVNGQQLSLSNDKLTDYTVLPLGDYQVSVEQSGTQLLSNYLLTINPNESKALVLNQQSSSELNFVEIDEEIYLSQYLHKVNVINLVAEFQQLDVTFVGPDETSETASNKLNNLAYLETDSLEIESNNYKILLTYQDENEQTLIIDSAENINLDQAANYLLVVEPDNSSASGLKITLTH